MATTLSPITIYHQHELLPVPEIRIKQLTKKFFTREKVSTKRAVSLVFCSDYRIRKLNREYRKIDKATDVLSFCFEDDDFLGEIYISLQRVKVQAHRFGLSCDEEILRLFTHGMIHLLGYDHIKEKDRVVMEAKEQEYFKV